jgi:very-short-patch-repair endonuclease
MLRINMTKEEKHLWYDFLKKLPITFHKQKVIGKYIVDFCCPSKKLIIELDGFQHYEDEGLLKDAKRDEDLKSLGYVVLRYTNIEVNQKFEDVCNDILKNLDLIDWI